MMVEVTIFFLAVSSIFYVVFAGADFGAGVIELVARGRREQVRKVIKEAMGPVWEANHIWLILIVVILFVGFSQFYATISTYLHIPLVLFLVGIIFRGCAFTFMHYDAVVDESRKWYSWFFSLASILSPLALGLVVTGLLSDKIFLGESFFAIFMAPWLTWSALLVGFFLLSLFSYLAACFLTIETDDVSLQGWFFRLALVFLSGAVFFGGLAFAAGYFEGESWPVLFLSSWLSLGAMVLATLSLPVLYWAVKKRYQLATRVVAVFQATLVVLGFLYVLGSKPAYFAIFVPNYGVLPSLVGALVVGSLLIFPALFYLFKLFKRIK